MRRLAAVIILAYGVLALFGVVVLAHPAHADCPFNIVSGDCALLTSFGGTLKHIGDFWLALAALPILALSFSAALFLNNFLNFIPRLAPLSRVYNAPRAPHVVLRRRRWLALVSAGA